MIAVKRDTIKTGHFINLSKTVDGVSAQYWSIPKGQKGGILSDSVGYNERHLIKTD
ncbi:hypothetical protein AAGQ96_02235 [Pantoea sp. MBD-2R]|uniref:hypothetical protein n=1 Tax=unclassified Pantoea TaxID=2630326 RepID=UPI00143CD731|nr:hypothetical protein [Pantoea sp. CCBC3-3-1]